VSVAMGFASLYPSYDSRSLAQTLRVFRRQCRQRPNAR
jgi:predicted protein tyrosine phosphatase